MTRFVIYIYFIYIFEFVYYSERSFSINCPYQTFQFHLKCTSILIA